MTLVDRVVVARIDPRAFDARVVLAGDVHRRAREEPVRLHAAIHQRNSQVPRPFAHDLTSALRVQPGQEHVAFHRTERDILDLIHDRVDAEAGSDPLNPTALDQRLGRANLFGDNVLAAKVLGSYESSSIRMIWSTPGIRAR